MKQVLVVSLALVLYAGTAHAQIPGCGSIGSKTDVWHVVGWRRLGGYSQSTRNLDGCLIKLRVEAWVQGVVMDVAVVESWSSTAAIYYEVPVPRYDTWTGVAKHWAILAGVTWNFVGMSSDSAEVKRDDDPPPPPQDEEPLPVPGCTATPDECGTPLLFDRNGDGLHLTSPEEGVLFDLDADGTPELVAWTRADSGDSWLAFDRNRNGRIDDGSELFGNATPAFPDQRELTARHGFDALGFLESPAYGLGASVGDDRIDGHDGLFSRLVLWTDANHNGISEPEELEPAAAAGLVSIGKGYKEKKRVDRYGNEFRLKGESDWTTGRQVVWDVWLRIAR